LSTIEAGKGRVTWNGSQFITKRHSVKMILETNYWCRWTNPAGVG